MIKNRKLIIDTLIVALLFGGSFLLGIQFYNPSSAVIKSDAEIKLHALAIDSVLQNDFKIQYGQAESVIPSATLQTWIEEYTRDYLGQKDKRLNLSQLSTYIEKLGKSIDSEPVNARIVINNSQASTFAPERPGKKLNREKAVNEIARAIFAGHSSATLDVDYIQPEITIDSINNLGINSLIGKGESDFTGSPTSRIHNIKTATQRFNGVIVKPGEEFSFNSLLGEVEASTGYKPELVIKNNKLEYEYGGGICQVSTTIFRAAIYAGLPIKERKNHSFPVRYYNPQGFDSTVYPGVVDLKFVNDTPNHILIQGYVVKNKLTFEIYGTDDGRKVAVDHPTTYDAKPDGSLKAYFNRTITTAKGEEIKNKFTSIYKPPVKYESNPLE
jgi:vancomycin resistance protein YoaR